MFHHVVPNAKATVSVTWRIPIRCKRSLMSKTFRPVTITCLLLNPEIRQEVFNYCSFDSPRKVAEFNADNRSIYDVYGHDNYIYKRWGEVETCTERKRGQYFANDSGLFSDIDRQTITNSTSSLKTTMKDRLVIVMRNICINYNAYSFEKLQRVISK